MKKTQVRPMVEADLERVLAWRNHADVRRYMYTQHEIGFDEHRSWFERSVSNPARHLLVFELEGTPTGFIHFNRLSDGGIADWGFYAAPDAPKGSGHLLGGAALDHAFVNLGFHKICGQALAYNERSINFHRRLGFQQEGILRDQHFDGERYHAVVCFGLLKHEWQPLQEG
ncbi:UDP-4-amino-4,6-dideoxy-N-acetyl-beta-L-altrosamine N-acetyltransferase [Pseudomonas sp. PIC25]|uniref:UDP-4-amino-4, 6-dideoxy-N-acetyl-beta-L-altrosamine N-acetyltransferase n=1 Tax=Pseudomonas sp. PIC25 TaxID=1958773 RepID=UPI002114AC59|nr:UDP-4-amino-4,6-dideoxy-N-acetyl-beta-L-altrosamine N-acetyltransferase [Pseudomonas sp. PIC25]